MAGYALISVEGVLADPDPQSFAASKPIQPGIMLYHSLKTRFKLVLASLQVDGEKVDWWLRGNGLRDHEITLNVPEFSDRPGRDAIRLLQITELRSKRGLHLSLAVESDPGVGVVLLEEGIPTMLFTRPAYIDRDFHPDLDRSPRPWEEIEDEINRQKQLRGEDERITADIAGHRFSD